MAFGLSTESLASASARHPWPVIGAWALALVAAIALIASLLGDALTTEIGFTNNPESKRAEALAEQVRGPRPANEIVIVRSDELTADDPQFKGFVEGLYGRVLAVGSTVVAGGTDYYQSGDESLVSKDRHTTILPFVMAGDEVEADKNIDKVLPVVEKADAGSEFHVLISGEASLDHDFSKVSEKDLQTGEAIGVPLALIVLVLVFGALAASVIPLGLGILSIVVALGVTALLGQQFEFAYPVTNVISMMGLAVGIDYSLFIVSRYREERARGLQKQAAIQTAGATASRAVFFSGMTVVFALLGMLIVPTTIFRSLAAGGIIVLAVSVLVSLTLLPAILGLIGDRVNALRVPFIGRGLEHADPERTGGFWDRITKAVMRYPVISLVVVMALLIALAVPYVDIETGSAGVSTLPDGIQSKEGFEILEEEFSFGLVTPAEVAIKADDVNGEAVQGAIQRLETALSADASYSPDAFQVNKTGDVGLLSIPVHGDPTQDEAISAIERLREQYIPAAFSGVDAEVIVGGITAKNMDYFKVTDDYTPIVLAFVLGLSFILLTVVFRSLIVPLKAIVMNLLSVGAAYGLLVLVFQKGIGNEIFGFQRAETIEAWVPLWLFSILFGLSMDYHVFLLSRIRERFNSTGDNSESVAFGVRSTAAIITGAALIMAGVFGGIAMGDLVMFQQMGFGLATAVLLDATIVRSVLVPAAMRLLGAANWYLPGMLQWLPEIRHDGGQARTERAERAPGGAEAS